MQVVKSVRVRLTLGDIEQHIMNLTKQQIISQFKLLLDRKQVQINQKIETNNAQHLLVLQKKMLILEKKDDQIVKLNNMLSSYKNQLQQVSIKNNDISEQLIQTKLKCSHYEKKYNQYDSIYKQQKAKKDKIKKQYDKLAVEYKTLSQANQIEVRAHKRIKDEKILWREQTQFLLNSLKKKHQQQLEFKIKNIKISLQNKISQLTYLLQEQKKKHESYKDKYNETKKNNESLKRVIQMLNKQLENEKIKSKRANQKHVNQIEIQTDSSLLKAAFLAGNSIFMQFMADKLFVKAQKQQKSKIEIQKTQQQTQTQCFQCLECKNLRNSIQNLQIELKRSKPANSKKQQKIRAITAAVQVSPPPPPAKQDASFQTIFTPLEAEQQIQLIYSFRNIVCTSRELIENWERKYNELELLYEARPARQQDRNKIRDLEKKLIQYQLKQLQLKAKIQKMQYLSFQLKSKIAQQNCFIDNVNMDAVEIRNLSKTMDTNQQNKKKSSFASTSLGFRTNTLSREKRLTTRQITSSTKDRSLSLDITQFRNGQFSLQLRADKQIELNNSNVIQLNNYSITEQQQQAKRQSTDNFKKLNSILLEKGISFKQNAKRAVKQQMSEARRYKKFKGILNKGKL